MAALFLLVIIFTRACTCMHDEAIYQNLQIANAPAKYIVTEFTRNRVTVHLF